MTEHAAGHKPGQEPIGFWSGIMLTGLTVLWAFNSVAVKVIVLDLPPFSAAFLRFAPAALLVGIILMATRTGIRITLRQFGPVAILGVLMGLQIFTFNLGSVYTSGGRVTLFIFSYPFFVSLLAPLFVREERLGLRTVAGAVIALSGLAVALSSRIGEGNLLGDLIECASGIILSIQVSYNKRVIRSVDKWKVSFWQFVVASVFFLFGALASERFDPSLVRPQAWLALSFQSVGISVVGILAWQYLLDRHSATKVSVFFFLTPIIGVFLTMAFLGEPFDPGLLAGALLVGLGIAVVYWQRKE